MGETIDDALVSRFTVLGSLEAFEGEGRTGHPPLVGTSRTPEERLRMASRMFSTARALVLSGAGTDEDNAGCRQYLFLRFYARDFSQSDRERILQYLTGQSS